jgi:hypothetical protein
VVVTLLSSSDDWVEPSSDLTEVIEMACTVVVVVTAAACFVTISEVSHVLLAVRVHLHEANSRAEVVSVVDVVVVVVLAAAPVCSEAVHEQRVSPTWQLARFAGRESSQQAAWTLLRVEPSVVEALRQEVEVGYLIGGWRSDAVYRLGIRRRCQTLH